MKTFESITKQFEKDLNDFGVSAYVVAVRNPDGEDTYWHRGSDIFWQMGVAQMILDRLRDICASIHNDEEEDNYDS